MFDEVNITAPAALNFYRSAQCLIDQGLTYDDTVLEFLKKADELGHPLAGGDLGIILIKKSKCQRDFKKAFQYINIAVQRKHHMAKLYLAFCFIKGLGTPLDIKQAIQLLNLFINSEHNILNVSIKSNKHRINAYLLLADIYHSKELGYYSEDKLYLNLCLAEKLGSLEAKENLASIIFEKLGKESNPQNLVKLQKIWLQKYSELAEQHYENSEFNLGCYYAYVNKNPVLAFIELNLRKAVEYLWRAGIGGNHSSFYHIHKITTEMNPPLSMQCYELAVKLNVSEACLDYGSNLFYNENSSPAIKMKGYDIVKSIANSSHNVVAHYACGLLNVELFRLESNLEMKTTYFWHAIKSLRKAGSEPHYFAKFELANLLLQQNGQFIKSYKQETLANLKCIIDFNSPTMNPNIKIIKREAEKLIFQLNRLPLSEFNYEQHKPAKVKAKSMAKKVIAKPLAKKTKFLYSNVLAKTTDELDDCNLADRTSVPDSHSAETEKMILPAAPVLEKIEILRTLPISNHLRDIFIFFENLNHSVYVVGGYVRDKLLDSSSVVNDIDIVTSAPVELVEQHFKTYRSLHIPTLCTVTIEGVKYDIQSVANLKSSINEDALKRDFTINALYLNSKGEVLDPLRCGIEDLSNKTNQLNSIGCLRESIAVDPFRILRFLVLYSRGFTSNYHPLVIDECITILCNILNSYISSPLLPTAEINIEDKVNLFGKFDYWLCKNLINSHSAQFVELAYQYHFFQKLFPKVHFSPTSLQWMKSRLIDLSNNFNTKKDIHFRKSLYSIILSAMINTLDDIDVIAKNILENCVFPTDLRWKIKVSELKIYNNEKHLFHVLPVEKHAQVREITAMQLSNETTHHKFKFFQHSPMSKPVYEDQTDRIVTYPNATI